MLAPVGTAILGYRTGDVIEWRVPGGRRTLRVEEILFQPEAAGLAALQGASHVGEGRSGRLGNRCSYRQPAYRAVRNSAWKPSLGGWGDQGGSYDLKFGGCRAGLSQDAGASMSRMRQEADLSTQQNQRDSIFAHDATRRFHLRAKLRFKRNENQADLQIPWAGESHTNGLTRNVFWPDRAGGAGEVAGDLVRARTEFPLNIIIRMNRAVGRQDLACYHSLPSCNVRSRRPY